MHHEWVIPISISSSYSHIIEHLVSELLPYVILMVTVPITTPGLCYCRFEKIEIIAQKIRYGIGNRQIAARIYACKGNSVYFNQSPSYPNQNIGYRFKVPQTKLPVITKSLIILVSIRFNFNEMYSFQIGNILSIFIGPLIMGSHISVVWIFFAIHQIQTSINHSNYHFPGLASPQMHDYHHARFVILRLCKLHSYIT